MSIATHVAIDIATWLVSGHVRAGRRHDRGLWDEVGAVGSLVGCCALQRRLRPLSTGIVAGGPRSAMAGVWSARRAADMVTVRPVRERV
jgi:hypothetical protein